MSDKIGIRHLIECRCILPQFKKMKKPPRHQFAVFSILEDSELKTKYSQCPNCGIIHKVFEVSKSEILNGKEHMTSIIKIDDLKMSLNDRLAAALEMADVDVSVWEHVAFVIESESWGTSVVLNKDHEGDDVIVKSIRILGANLFKIESDTFQFFVKG